jgi:tetratricopeptide (TPR) repeat protein
LRKIKDEISYRLDNPPRQDRPVVASDLVIQLPRFELEDGVNCIDITDMEKPPFWHFQALNEEKFGMWRYENAVTFYEKGLKKNLTSMVLLYNLARILVYLCKFEEAISWFDFGLKLEPRWVNGLTALSVCYFQMGYHSTAIQCIVAAQANYKNVKHSAEKVLFTQTEIQFLLATYLRSQGEDLKAQIIYSKLRPFFKIKEDEYFNDVLTSVILLLLQYDRKLTTDSFKEIELYFDLINDPHERTRTKPELLLSSYGLKTNKAQ